MCRSRSACCLWSTATRPPTRATTSATADAAQLPAAADGWSGPAAGSAGPARARSATRAARLASRNSTSRGARTATAVGDLQRRLESGATQEGRRLPVEVRPHRRGLADPAEHDQLAAVVLDPLPQPWPLPDQRLVGDLDGRHPGLRVHVEREQPGCGPAVQDLRRGVQLLAARRAGGSARPRRPPRPGARRAERTCSPVGVVERVVEPFGTGRDRPVEPTERPIGGERERPVGTALGELEEDRTAAPAALPAPRPASRPARRPGRARRCARHAAPARPRPPRPRPAASPGSSRSRPGRARRTAARPAAGRRSRPAASPPRAAGCPGRSAHASTPRGTPAARPPATA